MNNKPGGGSQLRCVRVSAWYLDPQATCGLPAPFGSKELCGGELRVRDWYPEGLRASRYELYCAKCKTCDPNGHSRQDAVMSEGLEYFNANA